MSVLKHRPRDAMWVFWWVGDGRDYPTSIVSSRRADLIKKVEAEICVPWRIVRADGGRAIRCDIVPQRPVTF